MRHLTASDLLHAWEAGQTLSVPERALALLAAADPDTPTLALARLTIGERDARLIDLREQCFGHNIVAVADCPNCGERSEITFDTTAVRAPAARSEDAFSIRTDAGDVFFRAVNSLDLIALADDSANDPRRTMAERCTTGAGAPLTNEQVGALATRLREVDSQAEVSVALACPGCGHAWAPLFDIATFLWREIDAWAERTLDDVHALATAYGWRETDILALSAWRRRQYLQRIGV